MQFSRADISKEHGYISANTFRQEFAQKGIPKNKVKVEQYQKLRKFGIGVKDEALLHQAAHTYRSFRSSHAMDAIQPTVTSGSLNVPVQFLQEWMPGFVYMVTAAREIDNLTGMSVMGEWYFKQVVQGFLERTGYSVPYDDYTNVPLSSYNMNYIYRTVIPFEEGMRVGVMEAAEAARVQVDAAGAKRQSCALALEIIRNTIGFFGWNNGANNTYGFLNDPGLPNYVAVPMGASGFTQWANKTFQEITNDIISSMALLRNNSQNLINPNETPTMLAIATVAVENMAKTTDFGISVIQWLKETYPLCQVTSAPQLNAANSGANVFYLYAQSVINDPSTDDHRTWIQPVPTKFMMTGVQQLAKGYEEDYLNATAGAFLKRPWAVVRRTGI